MRILLLTTGLRLGGAEQQIAALARQFRELGHAVAIVSLTPDCEVAMPAGTTLLRLAMRKTPLSMAAALRQVLAFVREWRPDVMHAHMVHANLFSRALTRLLPATDQRPPLICTAHSYREGGRLRMLAYRLTDPWSSLTTHVGAQGRQRMVDAGASPAARIIVVPNGIDTGIFRPDPAARAAGRAMLGVGADERLILSVGRLVPEKAQEVLLRAFSLLPHGGPGLPRARLMIAGDGPLRGMLQQRIDASGLSGHASLLGARSDIPTLLNAADLFVLSSEIEGMPLVVGEALACGCPVVATDAPGVAEMLGPEPGLLVARGDAPALAMAMRTALAYGRGAPSDEARRHRRIAEHLSLEAVAAQWLERYAQLLPGAERTNSTKGRLN